MSAPIFRSSSLSEIVSKSGKLTEGGKTKVLEVYNKIENGYEEPLYTDGLEKGHITESASRILVRKVLGGEARKANTERLSNDYINGLPDCILDQEDIIEDYKAPNNLRTFRNHIIKHKEKGNIDYNYWVQGQSYMWLANKNSYRLIYCLHPDDDLSILEQEKKYFFKFNCDEENEDYIKICDQIRHNNYLINELPIEKRVYVIQFDRDPDFEEKAIKCIEEARSYYKKISGYL